MFDTALPTIAITSVSQVPTPMLVLALLAIPVMMASVVVALLHRMGRLSIGLPQIKRIMIGLQIAAVLMLVISFLITTATSSNAGFLGL